MKESKKQTLISQITSMRAAADAALSILLEEGDRASCEHKNVQDYTTMGGPENWVCKDCGYEYKEDKEL